MIELGIDGYRRNKALSRVEPERLASPNQTTNAVAIQLNFLTGKLDFVFAAMLQDYFATRQSGQRSGQLVSLHVPHQHHLNGGRSVTADGKEAFRNGCLPRNLVFANSRA